MTTLSPSSNQDNFFASAPKQENHLQKLTQLITNLFDVESLIGTDSTDSIIKIQNYVNLRLEFANTFKVINETVMTKWDLPAKVFKFINSGIKYEQKILANQKSDDSLAKACKFAFKAILIGTFGCSMILGFGLATVFAPIFPLLIIGGTTLFLGIGITKLCQLMYNGIFDNTKEDLSKARESLINFPQPYVVPYGHYPYQNENASSQAPGTYYSQPFPGSYGLNTQPVYQTQVGNSTFS